MTQDSPRVPLHLWIVGLLGVVYFAAGIPVTIQKQRMSPDFVASLPTEHIVFIESLATWYWIAMYIALVAGLIGFALLLLRKAAAAAFLLGSLIVLAIAETNAHYFSGPMPGALWVANATLLLLLLIHLGFWGYAEAMKRRGVLG